MKNIIILEDNRDLAEGLRDVIESVFDYRVVITEKSSETIERLQQESFDLGLFDVNLPEKNGIAALKEIRQLGYRLPIIFMTGFRIPQVINETFPAIDVNLLSGPDPLSEIKNKRHASGANKITFAYGSDESAMKEAWRYYEEEYGFQDMDPFEYSLSKEDVSRTRGWLYRKDVTITDALAHILFLRELDVSPPAVVIGTFKNEKSAVETYADFNVTGCIFKPFELADLLALMESKLSR